MAMLTVNGVDFPNPAFPDGYNIGIFDIVKNAQRNASSGLLYAEKITQKIKLEIKYKTLTPSEYATILTTLASSFFFTVEYIDPRTGASNTGTFYVGDRSNGTFWYDSTAEEITYWKDIGFNFIEQ